MNRTHEQRTDSDCLRCCLATLLAYDYEDVPDFYGDELRKGAAGSTRHAWLNCQAWLARQGYAAIEVPAYTTTYCQPFPDGTAAILSGTSPRNPDWEHCCVGEWHRGIWSVTFDPHPSRAGMDGVKTVMFLAVRPPVTLGV